MYVSVSETVFKICQPNTGAAPAILECSGQKWVWLEDTHPIDVDFYLRTFDVDFYLRTFAFSYDRRLSNYDRTVNSLTNTIDGREN